MTTHNMKLSLNISPFDSWFPGNSQPRLIAGPCSAETEEQVLATARLLAAMGKTAVLRAGIWKPRTRPGEFEGIGSIGLEWLKKAKAETGLPTAVEVANAKHVEEALAAGAAELPAPFKALMQVAAKVMTTVAHRI
jgi:chorismate mutase